jgi:hypothetical protein
MIVQAPANMNKSVLLGHFERVTTVYIKQYGPGNLRLAGNPNDLDSTIGLAIQDGIVIVTANGFAQFFWEGDLWAISDAAGAIVMVVPAYQFYIDRLRHGGAPNGEIVTLEEGDLSTYR